MKVIKKAKLPYLAPRVEEALRERLALPSWWSSDRVNLMTKNTLLRSGLEFKEAWVSLGEAIIRGMRK